MIISIIFLIAAIWLFVKFVGVIFRMSWGLLKIILLILGILMWPVTLGILLSLGLIIAVLPVILICGTIDLIGKALS
ncbi:MAG: hypothetical protein SOH80_09885 [Eubacteriales bacterium]|jgi:hypothetical protein